MAKPKERIKARELRKKGESIKIIASKLKVSSSTVSIWCRDILLTPDQIKELEIRAHDPCYGRRGLYLSKLKKKREKKEKELLEEGEVEIGGLTERDLFICGVVLYWAEGFKKESLAGFANSDPRMIKLFLRWLRESCHIPESHIKPRIGLNESHRHRTKEVEKYWSGVAEIPLNRFQKPFYQKVKWVKQYENPEDYFGVLRIRVAKSTDFLRKIHGWISGVSEAGSRLVSKDVS
jgi:hypothetical protein